MISGGGGVAPHRRLRYFRRLAAVAARAPVAQLDRAPDYESGGQRFESFRARHSSHHRRAGCARSSTGQSTRLRIWGLGVRIFPGAPDRRHDVGHRPTRRSRLSLGAIPRRTVSPHPSAACADQPWRFVLLGHSAQDKSHRLSLTRLAVAAKSRGAGAPQHGLRAIRLEPGAGCAEDAIDDMRGPSGPVDCRHLGEQRHCVAAGTGIRQPSAQDKRIPPALLSEIVRLAALQPSGRCSDSMGCGKPWCPVAAWLGCRGSRDGGLDLRAPRPGSVPALSPGPAGFRY